MKPLITSALLFSALLSFANACSTVCITMSYYKCTVCYQDCGDFTLTSCKKRYCAAYSYDDDYDSGYSSYSSRRRSSYRSSSSSSNRRCVHYAYYSYSEGTCISECCGDAGAG